MRQITYLMRVRKIKSSMVSVFLISNRPWSVWKMLVCTASLFLLKSNRFISLHFRRRWTTYVGKFFVLQPPALRFRLRCSWYMENVYIILLYLKHKIPFKYMNGPTFLWLSNVNINSHVLNAVDSQIKVVHRDCIPLLALF